MPHAWTSVIVISEIRYPYCNLLSLLIWLINGQKPTWLDERTSSCCVIYIVSVYLVIHSP